MNGTGKGINRSPMVKFRSSLKFDNETQKWYHMGMALRQNGNVEFYSDFTYVDTYDELRGVNIEAAGD